MAVIIGVMCRRRCRVVKAGKEFTVPRLVAGARRAYSYPETRYPWVSCRPAAEYGNNTTLGCLRRTGSDGAVTWTEPELVGRGRRERHSPLLSAQPLSSDRREVRIASAIWRRRRGQQARRGAGRSPRSCHQSNW